MVSAKAMHHNDKETGSYQTHLMKGRLVFKYLVQSLKSWPRRCTGLSIREDIALIDINMGCPAPKIVKTVKERL